MVANLKNFLSWCRRHIIIVTVLCVLLVVAFGFVNVEILHMTSEPEFCAMCHPEQGFGPLAEVDSWEHSGHSEAGVSCLDCHGRPGPIGYMKAKLGGLKDTYMQMTISAEEKLKILSNPEPELVPEEQCLFCHSDAGNHEYRENHPGPLEIVHMRLLDSVENPEFRMRKGLPDIMTDTFVGGTHFDHALHIEGFELTCRDCHFGVVHQPGTKTDRMNYCAACHAENEGSSAPQLTECTVCHEAQLAMNEGKGAKGINGDPSMMYGADITCTMCHTGVEEGVYRPSVSTCTDCHGESQGYEEIFADWQTEIKKTISSLNLLRADTEKALLAADESGRDTAGAWELYQKALYNFNLVKDDGTSGVHNIDYARDILVSAETDFKKVQADLKRKW